MNANELADYLETSVGTAIYARKKAATMLRTIPALQAENEKLKAEIVAIEKNTDYWADKANWIKNNEPVAYVSTTGLNDIEWTDKSHLLNYGDALYTHPVKELTDEEILKQLETVIGSEKFEFSNDPMWIKFARAILRKAQEK